MEPNIEEALRAKANAERKFAEKDFVRAKNYALKAQMLCPQLEGISHMVATFGVHSAAETKVNGEYDFYSILGLDPSADRGKLKKQYKRMAVLLHPDKNKSLGADGAFRLVSDAWTVLSDGAKRSAYDHRRSLFTLHSSGVGNYDSYSNPQNRRDTFWTVCTSCHVQYEYLRKYVNKRLSCKNCRGVFIAVETGLAPVNGSYALCPWPCVPENGYGNHGSGVTYAPTSPVYSANNGVSRHHTAHSSEHVSNLSFQWSSLPGNSAGVLDSNGSSTAISFAQQENWKATSRKPNGKQEVKKTVADVVLNGYSVSNGQPPRRPGRPSKKRKVEVEITRGYSNGEVASEAAAEVKTAYGNGNENLKKNAKLLIPEASIRRFPVAPAFDARKLLIDKARTEIRKKLEEIRLASEAAAAEAEKKRKTCAELGESSETPKRAGLGSVVHQSDLRETGSLIMTVPDSDFHDFDKDRSEDFFKPKQIWALYDEEDGMPRLYCLIRQVISVRPFQIHISYLSSKSDSEFGQVNWLDSGFTKSCGSFRAFNSEIVEQVNIFSHLLSREKAGRGGCVRIYPRSGDVWALYRNWSPEWNRKTPDEMRHKYEMVEVLDDYSEEFGGVSVTPLVKLDGFKTVYQKNTNNDAIRWIPRREMLRFSHQVPSCLLKGESMNLPEGCWDLDPAATPDDLLKEVNEQEERPLQPETSAGFDQDETCEAENNILVEEKLRQPEYSAVPDKSHEAMPDLLIQDNSNERQTLFRPSTELLLEVNEHEEISVQAETSAGFDLDETSEAEKNILVEKNFRQSEYFAVPDKFHWATPDLQIQDNLNQRQNLFRPSTELLQEVNEQEDGPAQPETSAGFDLDIFVEDELRQPEYSAVPDKFHWNTPGLQIQANSGDQQNPFRPSTEFCQVVNEQEERPAQRETSAGFDLDSLFEEKLRQPEYSDVPDKFHWATPDVQIQENSNDKPCSDLPPNFFLNL